MKLGRDRLFEVLRQRQMLVPRRVAERPCTTSSAHRLPIFTNRIKDLKVSRPNQVWVSDLTYLRTRASFLYLALITDKASRKIVGYHCGDTLEAEGCAGLGDGFERTARRRLSDSSLGSWQPVLLP